MENHETSAGRINYRPVFLYIAISREIYNARYRDEINQGIDLVVTTRCKVNKGSYEEPADRKGVTRDEMSELWF